jgi:hypothetical protein
MDIKEFRAKHPQYDDMDDQVLSDALYNKHYSDMPREKFDASFTGISTQEPAKQGSITDVPLEFMAGANNAVLEGLDFLGPDQVNAVLQMSGSEKRVPTLSGSRLGREASQGGFMQPGTGRDITRAAGSMVPAAIGMKSVPGRNVASLGGAAAEVLGAGSAAVAAPIKQGVATAQNALPSRAKSNAKLPLLRQSGDIKAAGYKIDDAGRVVSDKIQRTALKAGIDEGAVAMISSANKPTKKRIKDMLDILEKGRNNLEFRNFNPPSKVVGEAITDRLKIIQDANRSSASRLDSVAESLKGRPVDVSVPADNFLENLAKEGINVDLQKGTLDFAGSTVEGLPKAQKIIKTVFGRIYNMKDPRDNAYRAHLAKRFIDEHVSYGKSQAGLSGRMENIIKQLRHDIDGTLDNAFPEYDMVNSVYSETRGIIDDLQGLAGKKVNLTGDNVDKALGTMSRKVLSNYNTGVAMEDMFKNMDEAARRHSTPLSYTDDELLKLISTESEIRKMFPTAIKPNTFQGEIGREVGRSAVDLATGNKIGLAGRAINAAGKVFSKSDEDKLKALRGLVE